MAEANSQYIKTYLAKSITKLDTFNRIKTIFSYDLPADQNIANIPRKRWSDNVGTINRKLPYKVYECLCNYENYEINWTT